MESEGRGGFLRGSRDGIDRAPQVSNSNWGIHTKGNGEFSTKKVLSEPNVKVVFHQTAVPVTLLSTFIIYPKRSALGHSTRCLAEAWLSEVDSLFCSRCRTCCAPLTKKGAGAAATWTPSFLLFPALSRAEPEFFIRKGRQSPKAAIPIGQRAERVALISLRTVIPLLSRFIYSPTGTEKTYSSCSPDHLPRHRHYDIFQSSE